MSDISKNQTAKTIRDSVHNLVIEESNEIENQVYFEKLKHFITVVEGQRNEAHLNDTIMPINCDPSCSE